MRMTHDDIACEKSRLSSSIGETQIETTMTFVAHRLEGLKSEVLATSNLELGGGTAGVTLGGSTEKSTLERTLKFLTELNGLLGPPIILICVRRMEAGSGNFSSWIHRSMWPRGRMKVSHGATPWARRS